MLFKLFIQKIVKIKILLMAALVLLIPYSYTAWGQPKSATKRLCANPIMRVYSEGDSYLPIGSLLCEGDRIHPINNGGKVDVLCFLNQKFVQLPSGSITSDKCQEPTANTEKKCTFQTLINCPKTRGDGENKNTPIVLSPYGNVLLDRRPIFSWYPVPGATSYKVYLTAYNLDWQAATSNTRLPYPQGQQELQYGIAYKFSVLVLQGEEVVGSASSVIYVPPENQVQDILEKVKKVNALALPADEAAYLDLDTVYMSKGLLNETIENMNARIANGSQNPTLYRVLGDRYLQAWLPQEAKRAYTKAIELAQSSGNISEMVIAQDRLAKLIESYSQLPTRINAAQ
ncbi:tetratricopeptide repeat protein [Nostoc sp. CHAB 5844]|nr:tetratricopeptide repeat protein [Nostoc sp. CHAB 5844]